LPVVEFVRISLTVNPPQVEFTSRLAVVEVDPGTFFNGGSVVIELAPSFP
jgi:hypothetical protein